MNLLTLVNALLDLNIRVSVQKADALYKALGLDQIAADLEYYRGECLRLNNLRMQDQDLDRLRAKLTGMPFHDHLVKTALGTASIMDNLANGKRVQAIKELRDATGSTIKEAKDAVEDGRVTYRASLPQSQRDLFY